MLRIDPELAVAYPDTGRNDGCRYRAAQGKYRPNCKQNKTGHDHDNATRKAFNHL